MQSLFDAAQQHKLPTFGGQCLEPLDLFDLGSSEPQLCISQESPAFITGLVPHCMARFICMFCSLFCHPAFLNASTLT